ncbi:hypothetical protein [Brevibacterium sp. CFH 10365]|uniref:hypothetical protein n=1 Tax=Brevibacterium sp. CFH 10365 TaxID=2585207 RepID=UPI0012662244|nr:hypothetical protein [Brevibacterium sp. CFH 10365]
MSMLERGSRLRRRIAAVIVAVVGAVGLTGCQGPDLTGMVEDIGVVLSAKPGVEDVETNYQNGFDSGKKVIFKVKMAAGATSTQARDVAAALDHESGDEFDGYDQKFNLTMPDRTISIIDRTNADIMAERTPRLLALAAAPSRSWLSWENYSDPETDADRLRFVEQQSDPFENLSAVRAEFGSESLLLEMSDTASVTWSVGFPFSEQGQNRLETAVEPIRDNTKRITIADDQVSDYFAVVPDGPDKVSRVRENIERIDATAADPWQFTWAVGPDPTGASDSSSGGVISVGGCDYDPDSEVQLTQEAEKTQDQLRRIYDTCR